VSLSLVPYLQVIFYDPSKKLNGHRAKCSYFGLSHDAKNLLIFFLFLGMTKQPKAGGTAQW
jgi:hypothetical protein